MSDLENPESRLESILRNAPAPPFDPPPLLRNAHLQTIWANLRPRSNGRPHLPSPARSLIVETPDGDRIRLLWNRHARDRPILLVLHGLTGCAEADNVLGVAAKAWSAGFDVVRADLRNSTGESPSAGVGHAGRSEDLRAALDRIVAEAPGRSIAVIGFSLGGNVTMKALGELGDDAPGELVAAAGISVPIDLDGSCSFIDRPRNAVYRSYFLRRMSRLLELRRRRFPDRIPELSVDGIRTFREWDDVVVAGICDFQDAEDYYRRCSALRVIDRIRRPTLLIQARDDPFIPFEPFRRPEVSANPWIRLLSTPHGGHVGFYAAEGAWRSVPDPDPYWAENRAIDFCRAAAGLPPPFPR